MNGEPYLFHVTAQALCNKQAPLTSETLCSTFRPLRGITTGMDYSQRTILTDILLTAYEI